jgi:hypothetical protein
MYAENHFQLLLLKQIMDAEADLGFELPGLQLAGPDMLVDEYEQYNNDRPDVVNISPDDASEEPAEVEPMADDCTCNGFPSLTASSDNLLGGTTSRVTPDILPSYPSHADV